MKKFFILPLIALFTLLCGCGTQGDVREEEIVVKITTTQSVLTITPETTLGDYLVALKEAGELDFKYETGKYGMFITEVNGKANATLSSGANFSEGYSWTVYADFSRLDDELYADGRKSFDGKVYYKSFYGVSALPCVENHSYVLIYEYYSTQW